MNAARVARAAKLMQAQQHECELVRFLSYLGARPLERVMEIGNYDGGTLWALSRAAAPGAVLIGLDLVHRPHSLSSCPEGFEDLAQPAGQQVYYVTRDSHDPATVSHVEALLGGHGLDLLVIDGDHSYLGVKQDWEMYRSLVRRGGIVAIHDICWHPPEDSCYVDRLWDELTRVHRRHSTIDDGEIRCGIGILEL